MEIRQHLDPLVGMLAIAHSDLAALLLAIPHHQHVRDLLHLRVADLQVHFLVALVHRRANARLLQLLLDVARILGLPVRNR